MRSPATTLRTEDHELILSAGFGGGRDVLRVRGSRPQLGPGPERALLQGDGETHRIALRDDGVLRITARSAVTFDVTWTFTPKFDRPARRHHVGLEGSFGAGVWGSGGVRRQEHSPRKERWSLSPGAELWLMALPARRPDQRRAKDHIAHEGQPRPFPESAYLADDCIEEIGRHADVFAWHAYFWREIPPRDRPWFSRYAFRRCPWMTRRHEPSDPDGMVRVLRAVRRAGMQPVAYISPRHARAADIVDEMRRIIFEYGFDGLYLDGLARDFIEADLLVRAARDLLGPDRLLYLNLGEGPFSDAALPAPFLEAQADYVLRGSNGRGGLPLPEFFRWVLAGIHTGGAQGFWCPYGSRGLWPRDQAPSPKETEVAYRNGVKIWRRSHWGRRPEALAAFDAQVVREKVRREQDLADKP